jgi:hypothetical protein
MRKDIQRGLYGLALATGIFILGTSEATAAETTGEDSLAGGTQASPELTTPVTVSDNAITLIGDPTTGSTDSTTGSTPGPTGRGTTAVTDGGNSIGGGTQITPVITAPIGIQDNAITVIGDPTTGSTDSTPGSAGEGTTAVTNGENSIGGGTQITPVITAPIGIQDNAITAIGNPTTGSTDGNTSGNTDGGTTGPAPVTNGENSLGGGTQITPVITAPITVVDNAVTVIGDPTTGSTDGNTSGNTNGGTTGPAPVTNGEGSLGGGTQATPVITAPIGIQDNAVTVIGDPTTGSTDSTTGSTPSPADGGTTAVTDGEDSIGGGTQATPVITAPITVEDNAITAIGNPTTGSTDGNTSGNTDGGSTGPAPVTNGENSIGGGTQITPVITAPIGIQDNAVTVIGDPTTGSTDAGKAPGTNGGTTAPTPVTDGEGSIGGGTQITPVITAPIGIQDNAVTVIGNPATGSTDGTISGNTDGGSTGLTPVTNGENSIGGGTQITPVITAPIGIQDNAVTVIGDPTTGSIDSDGETTDGTDNDGTNNDSADSDGTNGEGTDGTGATDNDGTDGEATDGETTDGTEATDGAGADGEVTDGGTAGGTDGAGTGSAEGTGGTGGAAADGSTTTTTTTAEAVLGAETVVPAGTAVTVGGEGQARTVGVASSMVITAGRPDAGTAAPAAESTRTRTGTGMGTQMLAHTGASTVLMAGLGMALLAAGIALVLGARRRMSSR